MITKSGRSFGNAQMGRAIDRSEQSKGGMKHGQTSGKSETAKTPHAPAEPHHPALEGSTPHPATGVHGVMITHHEGQAHQTHTYHSPGGEPETMEHGSMAEAHEHAQQQLPADDMNEPNEPDGDEDMGTMGKMAGSFGNANES